MKTINGSSKLKFLTLVMLLFIMVSSCYVYHNNSVYKSIGVVMSDKASVEYGSANYDIKKMVKEVEGEIVSVKKDIDMNTLGRQEVVLEVKKDNIVKDVPIVVSVVDTVAPVIQLDKDSISITEGDSYDLGSNILSVNDAVTGDLTYTDNLDNSKNSYTISHDDLSSVGSHDITVTAVDKSGNKTVSTFKLNVEAKPKPVENVQGGVNSNSNNINVPANVSGNSIVNIAYSLLGKPYVGGTAGPNSFDCSGLVQYVYSQVGKSVSRSARSQINDGVGIDYSQAQPGDILSWNGGAHSAIYVGNGQMIHSPMPGETVSLISVSYFMNRNKLSSVRRIG